MTIEEAVKPAQETIRRALANLGARNLVFVGLMGAGKSAIGRVVAQMLAIPFIDSDHEIERVSRMSITDLFESYGESEFRSLEARVIERLMKGGPGVVATGGGAFMNAQTRELIADRAVSVWLKADLELLWDRVSRRDHRPLLNNPDPKGTLEKLMGTRYPTYAEAAITIHSREEPKAVIAGEVIATLADLAPQGGQSA